MNIMLYLGAELNNDAIAVASTPEEHSKTIHIGERGLWAVAMGFAISDLYLPPNNVNNSVKWFLSNSTEVGSYLWICFMLDLPADKIIRRYGHRIKFCLENMDGDLSDAGGQNKTALRTRNMANRKIAKFA